VSPEALHSIQEGNEGQVIQGAEFGDQGAAIHIPAAIQVLLLDSFHQVQVEEGDIPGLPGTMLRLLVPAGCTDGGGLGGSKQLPQPDSRLVEQQVLAGEVAVDNGALLPLLSRTAGGEALPQ